MWHSFFKDCKLIIPRTNIDYHQIQIVYKVLDLNVNEFQEALRVKRFEISQRQSRNPVYKEISIKDYASALRRLTSLQLLSFIFQLNSHQLWKQLFFVITEHLVLPFLATGGSAKKGGLAHCK